MKNNRIPMYNSAVAALACAAVLAVVLVIAVRDSGARAALADNPAPNDNFAAAGNIQSTDLPFVSQYPTTGTTLEAGETAPCAPVGATSWYTLHSQTAGTIEISTAGSDFDTVVAVYTPGNGFIPSPPGANLIPAACNDDYGTTTSFISLAAAQYSDYFIQFGGKNGATGNLNLRIACNPSCPPQNDNSTSGTYVSVNSYGPKATLTADTHAATDEPGEPRPCGNIGKTVWYQFYADQDVSIIADTTGSNFDTVIAAYSYGPNFPASPPGGFTPITCNDNAIGSQSRIAFEVKQSQVYWIQAGGAGGLTGDLVVNIACSPVCPPFNNNLNNVGSILPPFDDNVSTAGATLEDDEPRPCGGIDKTVWYSVYVTGPTTVSVDTAGSDFDTVVAAYALPYGDFDMTTLKKLACNDNSGSQQARLTFPATTDRQFVVQVGGHNGATGNLVLHLDCDPVPCPPQNDSSSTAWYLNAPSDLPFRTVVDTRGATVEPNEPTNCGDMTHSIWFTLNSGSGATVAIDTAGSDFDTAVAVYTGPPDSTPARLSCGVSAAGTKALVELSVPASSTLFLQVGSANGGHGGMLDVAVACAGPCPPRNDSSGFAYSLYPSDFGENVDTTGATLEPNEPRPCGDIGATVWYAVTALEDVRVRVTTDGTQFPTVLAAYETDAISPPGGVATTTIGCESNATGATALEFDVVNGHTYFVQAGGVSGAKGMLSFHLSCVGGPCTIPPDAGGPRGGIAGPDTGSGGYLPGARD